MLAEAICERLKRVYHGPLPVALHEPSFVGSEWEYVRECLDTGWVSSAGKYVDRFEAQLREYTGVKSVAAVVNGTAALHACLRLVGVEAGDEVLVPTLTFVATANAVAYCGAVPHFLDSDETTLGVDPFKLEQHLEQITELRSGSCVNRRTGRRIRALVPMHTFGHPVDLDPLLGLARRFGLDLVEDAAESLGSLYRGVHTGHWGRISALSFNGNKIITTGGGGAIITNDERLGALAKHLTTTAKLPHAWAFNHDMVGYNYRLPNINAALGVAQLEQLPSLVEKHRALAERYVGAFKGLDGARIFVEPVFARSNYWLNVLLLDKGSASERDAILEATRAIGFMTRPAWTLRLPMYASCPRMDLSTAESLEQRVINLPSSSFL